MLFAQGVLCRVLDVHVHLRGKVPGGQGCEGGEKRAESGWQAVEDLRATEHLLISKAAWSNRTAKMETVPSALSSLVATGHVWLSST